MIDKWAMALEKNGEGEGKCLDSIEVGLDRWVGRRRRRRRYKFAAQNLFIILPSGDITNYLFC